MDDIIERAFRGEATATELEQLAAWRAADGEHERKYGEVMRILHVAQGLRPSLAAGSMSGVPSAADLIARGAAAGRAVPPAPPSTSGVPRVRGTRTWVPWGIAAAAAVTRAVQLARARPQPGPPAVAEVVTGAGELATVQLGDGSVVRLAPASRLKLSDGGDPRSVVLDGRAFFAVAKQADHPFWVRTRAANARVLGTRFEVVTAANDLHLVVLEGRVALEAPGNTVEVAAGEASIVANGTARVPVRVAHADSALRWVGKFLAFQATPLDEVAKELEATYGVHITVTDSSLAEQTVTASFTEQSFDTVLGVLCSMLDAHCTARGDAITISRR